MKTYWKAETYEHGVLGDIDFPEQPTQKEAAVDATNALGRYTEDERRQQRITAFAVEWTEDEDGGSENTGSQIEVDHNGNIIDPLDRKSRMAD